MKTITIVLSSTNSWSSRFICWAQRCNYSHVEALFDDYSIGARTKGVMKYTNFSHMTNVRHMFIDCTDLQYGRFIEYLESKIGERYDWRAYLGFMFFKNAHSTNRWFCSELILEAFNYAEICVVMNTPSYFCTPRDFLISPALTDA
jgi:uncharacterized protein YycO